MPKDDEYEHTIYNKVEGKPQVIVVGAGPGGLFAALRLIELGLRPVVIERGKDVRERKKDLAQISREHTVGHCVEKDGRSIHLADMEYRILTLFIRHPNTFFTANELYRKIWGKESLGDVRTVQVHIHNLRSKIEPDPAKPIYLKNVWGKGYIFRPEGETEA